MSTVSRWIAPILLGLLVAGSIPAQTPTRDSAPEPIDRHLRRLSKVISNAKVKLKHGAGEFAPAGSSSDAPPAWACCIGNLKRIEKSVVAIQGMLEQLEDCYEENAETDAVIVGRLTQTDLQALARAVQVFADSPTVRVAEAALESVARTYFNLTDSAEKLIECGDLLDPSIVPAEESETQVGESSQDPG
jgi:hypothetical protein